MNKEHFFLNSRISYANSFSELNTIIFSFYKSIYFIIWRNYRIKIIKRKEKVMEK